MNIKKNLLLNTAYHEPKRRLAGIYTLAVASGAQLRASFPTFPGE